MTPPRLDVAWEVKAKVVNINVKSVGPQGAELVLDDVGEMQGIGRFPSGTFLNTCNAIRNPWPEALPQARSGASDDAVMYTDDGETIFYKTHGFPGQILEGGLRRGVSSLNVWTMSEKYSWMNKILFVRDAREVGTARDQAWEGAIYAYTL